MSRKCETFSCKLEGIQMLAIAPGTNLWLCAACVKLNEDEDNGVD